MESLFLIPGLGAPTGLEWLQLDHVLNVRGCICGRCVGKGAEVLWVIWAFISYIGFRNKHSSSVFYWFGHISGFDPKKTRTQNLGIKWIYRYIYAWQMTTYSLQINKSGSFDDETGLWAVRPFPIISIGFWILSAGLGSQLSSTFQKNSNRSSLDKQNSNPLNH